MKIGMTRFANAHDRFYDAPVLILDVSVSKNDIGEDVVSYIPHSAFSMVNLQPASGSVMLKEFGKQYDAQYRLSAPLGTMDEKNAVEIGVMVNDIMADSDGNLVIATTADNPTFSLDANGNLECSDKGFSLDADGNLVSETQVFSRFAVLALTQYETYVVAMLGKERNNG